MCYSGKGRLEGYMGECNVKNHQKFKEEMGLSACLVCMGYDFDVDEAISHGEIKQDDLYTEEALADLSKSARDKGLIW